MDDIFPVEFSHDFENMLKLEVSLVFQLQGFYLIYIFIWFFCRDVGQVKFFLHSLHSIQFSPVLPWFPKEMGLRAFPHSLHTYHFSPVCTLMCPGRVG